MWKIENCFLMFLKIKHFCKLLLRISFQIRFHINLIFSKYENKNRIWKQCQILREREHASNTLLPKQESKCGTWELSTISNIGKRIYFDGVDSLTLTLNKTI